MRKVTAIFSVVLILSASFVYSDSETLTETLYIYLMGQEYNDYVLDHSGKVYIALEEVSDKMDLTYNIKNQVHLLTNDISESEIQYANGDVFVGKTECGKRQGEGTLYKLNGTRLSGVWSDNTLNGIGSSVDVDGNIYEGDFYLSFKYGEGTMYYKNGDKYKGDWKFDLREGEGIQWYNDGNRYTGYWKNGMYNGYGKLFVNKTFKEGLFENGQYVRYMKDPSEN